MADNETKISLSFKNNVSGTTKLDKYATQLERIYGVVSALDKGQNKVLFEVQRSSNKTTKAMEQTEKATKNLGKQFNTAFNIAGITAFTHAATKLFTSLTKMATKSSEYIENVNLLEVAYKNANETIEESSERIETFISKMAEVYGFDESRLTRQFGIFKQLANAMELPAQEGERLSEIMVKMTNDVASLYNLDLERASNALQSALVGQTRPIRGATGADITEKTLQRTVDALGLDREMSQLSFVEKRLIMVISLTNQLKASQGDYARTIESASNQIRVMKEQWDRLSRAVGNVFYPILQKVLPYINGVLMALTEIFNLLASLLGFEMPEFDYSSLSGASDVVLDLEDALGGASDNVDKLASKMKGLRGFDKLNVINTPSSAGGASVSGGAGGLGVDPKIMEAFNKAFEQYDDLMDSVRMKARDIRDSIMEWLGFTKKINPLTGEISWEYEGIEKTLSNMWNSFKNLNPLAKAFVAFGIWKAVKQIWTWGGKAAKALGLSGLGGSIKKVLIDNIHILNDESADASKGMDRLKTAITGVTLAYIGQKGLTDAMDRTRKDGKSLISTLELMGSYLSQVAGMALAGAAAFGPLGAAAGGALGSIMALFQYFAESKKTYVDDFIEANTKSLNEFSESLNQQFEELQKNASLDMTKIEITDRLVEELDKIVDANGRVKEGYEDRAKFIVTELNKAYDLEIEYIDGQIVGYDGVIKSLKEITKEKKAQIYLNLAEEQYTTALKNQAQAELELKKVVAERNLIQTEYAQKIREIEKDTTISSYAKAKAIKGLQEEEREELAKTQKRYEEASKNLDLIQEAKYNYIQLSTAIANNDTKQIDYYADQVEEYFDKMAQAADKSYNGIVETGANAYDTELSVAIETFNSIERAAGKSYKNMTEAEKSYTNDVFKDITDKTEKLLSYGNNELSPEMIEIWSQMANQSEDAFLAAMDRLPDDVKQNVVDNMYSQGVGISTELQRGIKDRFPQIKIPVEVIEPSTYRLQQIGGSLGEAIAKGLKINLSGFGMAIKANKTGGILVNNSWKDITAYAGGGLPPVGQIFAARENGPELVGQIGNHTAVMNNDQIVGSVANGVYQAVRSAMGTSSNKGPQVYNIYLDKDRKLATYMLDDLDEIAKSNGKPIEIGGY